MKSVKVKLMKLVFMLSHLTLKFVLSSGLSFDQSNIVVILPESISSKSGPLEKKTCLLIKSKSFLEAEWFTFRPKSGQVEAKVSELALKFEIMKIQVAVTDAKLQADWETSKYFEILYIYSVHFKSLS